MTEEVLVDVIVPVYGALAYLKRCVGAVLSSTSVPYLLWLADDCSPPDSGVHEYLRFVYSVRDPRIRIILGTMNLGYGAVCNQAAAQGSAPFICNLNSDTEVQPGWLSAMLANMGNLKVGMVGAKLVYPSLSKQTNHTHLPGRIEHAGLYFGADKAPRAAFQNYLATHPLVNRRIEVSGVTHACVLMRRSAFGSGYDTQYKVGAWEDVDMCLRFKQEGYEIIYEPEAVVWHAQGASYNHHMSTSNFTKLMLKWEDFIEPDPDIFSRSARKHLPKPERWWKQKRAERAGEEKGSSEYR